MVDENEIIVISLWEGTIVLYSHPVAEEDAIVRSLKRQYPDVQNVIPIKTTTAHIRRYVERTRKD